MGSKGQIVQSVANSFSDEQIWIWITFAKDILYKHKYEYYSWHLGSRVWIRILFVRNIHKYFQIFEYIRIFKNNQIPGHNCFKAFFLLRTFQILYWICLGAKSSEIHSKVGR